MKYDYKEAERLVQRDIYACISDMAPYLFGWEEDKYASYDEWENLYEPHCPECGCRIEPESDKDDAYTLCSDCLAFFDKDEIDMQPAEVYEYWLVSDWLGEKLLEKGEPVLKRWSAWVWGRCSTGQAIALDGVINEIAAEALERAQKTPLHCITEEDWYD